MSRWHKMLLSGPGYSALAISRVVHSWRFSLNGSRNFSTGKRARKDFIQDLEGQFKAIREKAAAAMPGTDWSPVELRRDLPPDRADIVVVGGGVIGWSVAYWLKKKERVRDGVRVLVVEKDPTYSEASTVLSAGGIRQQFSLKENIQLSLASVDFMRNINEHLWVLNEDPIDLQFNHSGYLFLASESVAHIMEENYVTQREHGAKVTLLSPAQLKERFPWLNTDGVVLASYGLENEGWFDPWSLLNAFRRKAMSMGVFHCHGEVTGFTCTTSSRETEDGDVLRIKRIKYIDVKMPDSREYQPVECAIVINAAGVNSGKIADMIGIGSGSEHSMAGFSLPVEPRKRYVYVVHCPDGPGLESPFLIDYSGVYFRREGLGGNYITGNSPEETEEPDISDLKVDHEFFQEKVWPHLSHRVPAFESLKCS